jgi:aspartate racemase
MKYNSLKTNLSKNFKSFSSGFSSKSKRMGTIGIIGLDPLAAANLNKEIVHYGNSIGMIDDQHFPEILTVGIKSRDSRYLQDQANLCFDFGCDLVAIPQKTGNSKLAKRISNDISSVPVFTLEQNIKELAKKVTDYANNLEKPRRNKIVIHENLEELQIIKNLKNDQKNRLKRINDRNEHGGYPVLKNGFIGVIGGAGPLASADFCFKLAQTLTPFVHYSANSAPGKHRFEMENGPSYIEHYKNAVNFFKSINATNLAIPCNTTHKRLEEFCENSLSKIIDIRQCVFEEYLNAEKFILFGTKATTGVGLNEGEIGAYEKLRCKKYSDESNFIVPSPQDQEKIMTAIYSVKAGELDKAKEIILDVVCQTRKEHGDFFVILGCTELPLVFDDIEICDFKFIDPAELLLAKCRQEIIKFQTPSTTIKKAADLISFTNYSLKETSNAKKTNFIS